LEEGELAQTPKFAKEEVLPKIDSIEVVKDVKNQEKD